MGGGTGPGVSHQVFSGENRKMLRNGSLRKHSSTGRPKTRATHQNPSEVGGHGRSHGLTQTTFDVRLLGSWAENGPDCGSRSETADKTTFSRNLSLCDYFVEILSGVGRLNSIVCCGSLGRETRAGGEL